MLGGADCVVDTAPVGVIVAPDSSDDDDVSEASFGSSDVLSGVLADSLPDVPDVGAGLSEPLVDPGVAGGGVEAEAELVAGLSDGESSVWEALPVVAAALEAWLVSGGSGTFWASEVKVKKNNARQRR